jgi:predicted alpha/beta hydrolase family esterase
MKHALILHAWYDHPNTQWYPWLQKELEQKGYVVNIPELPTMNTELPDLEQQLNVTTPLVKPNSVVMGHSLGSLLAMRIAETNQYDTMILVAGWDFNELTTQHQLFWKTPMNHDAIKKNVKNIYVVSSDNDPYITAVTADDMCKRLGGKFILAPGAGHFTTTYGVKNIPQILDII